MGTVNKVKVRIFGQEYTISGYLSEREICDIADYVDHKMNEAAKAMNSMSQSNAAVLSAVNVASELYEERSLRVMADKKAKTLEMEVERLDNLWKEVKGESSAAEEELEQLRSDLQLLEEKYGRLQAEEEKLNDQLQAAEEEAVRAIRAAEEAGARAVRAEEEAEKLRAAAANEGTRGEKSPAGRKGTGRRKKSDQMAAADGADASEMQIYEVSGIDSDMYQELQESYANLEANFYDMQMENMRLKNELDKYEKE